MNIFDILDWIVTDDSGMAIGLLLVAVIGVAGLIARLASRDNPHW